MAGEELQGLLQKAFDPTNNALKVTGGGSSNIKQAVLSGGHHQVTSSTVLQNVTGLSVSLDSTGWWRFWASLFVYGAAAGDIKIAFTGPANNLIRWGLIGISTGVVSGSAEGDSVNNVIESLGTAINAGVSGGTPQNLVLVEGMISATATGTLQLQMAQVSSNAIASQVSQGSSLRAEKVI